MISVVIPVWNRAGMVGRTLEVAGCADRVARQSGVGRQMIPPTIRHVCFGQWAMGRKRGGGVERVPGAAAARNCGLAAVDSEYVMFFDGDDVMPAGHVADVVRGLRDNGLPDIGAFDAVIRTDSGAVMPKPSAAGT